LSRIRRKVKNFTKKLRVESEMNYSQLHEGRLFVSVVVSSQETEPEAHISQLSDSE
jgi:hypothetical protein